MKAALAKAIAAIALAIALAVAVPLAAQAAYVPSGTSNPPIPVTPGQTTTLSFAAHTFDPDATVSFTLVGDDASEATLAVVVAVQKTFTARSAHDGSLTVNLRLPAGAAGNYTSTFTDGTHTVVVTLATGVPATAGSGIRAAGSGLAHTGEYVSLAAIWGGIGIILLGTAFISVRVVSRRHRARASRTRIEV